MSSFNKSINQSRQFVIATKVFLPTTNNKDFDVACAGANSYRALVDTGANSCSISQKIVADLVIAPHNKFDVMTAAGPHTTFAYLVGIAVPVAETKIQHETQSDGNVVMKSVVVSESWSGFQQSQVTTFPDVGDRGFDIILGMDMLAKFHITIYNGNIVVSI